MTTRFDQLLPLLAGAGVRFIIVGGFAATLHGAARLTLDLDLIYARDRDNLTRLVGTLAPLHPYLRGAPPGLPFRWDEQTLRNGLNFTLLTDLGSLDLLGDIPGGRDYAELLPHSVEMEIFGVRVRCVSLDKLIQVKNAAGRAKDFEALAELLALRDGAGPLPAATSDDTPGAPA